MGQTYQRMVLSGASGRQDRSLLKNPSELKLDDAPATKSLVSSFSLRSPGIRSRRNFPRNVWRRGV